MKLLSFQPFSLYANGGGSRILRRIYHGHEDDITSLVVSSHRIEKKSGAIKEIAVLSYPVIKPWMKWYLRIFAFWLSRTLLKKKTVNKLRKQAASINFEVLHVIDHGIFSDALCDDAVLEGKQLWVSFHDYFSTSGGTTATTKSLWQNSDRRFVISKELGKRYEDLFGQKGFEMITDGLYVEELTLNNLPQKTDTLIYFSGLLHTDYYPLFECLADTLDQLNEKGNHFKLVLRGTQQLDFLNNRKFTLEYLPFSLDNDELKKELDEADILYLPIKFSLPEFYLYSLSTKMIGYFGAPGVILYHGPVESAANKLLRTNNAAISCTTLDKKDLAKSILECKANYDQYSYNTIKLARENFLITKIQQRFWDALKV